MRLWSIHPKYLDAKGLVALWREALLAKAVLNNQTKGYKNHPQLKRFNKENINIYLKTIYDESVKRGYNFNKGKIGKIKNSQILVNSKQCEYELKHLKNKLKVRSPQTLKGIKSKIPELNPMFKVRTGEIEKWEKILLKHMNLG